tara:strand:+ start:4218 stop:4526 length:309 start_codon:yes stop_codon:yes gene_type:complete
MIEKKLSSGTKILIRELSIDKMDELKDMLQIVFHGDQKVLKNMSKTRTAWVRAGLGGCGDWKTSNGAIAPDAILKQLTDEEMNEASQMIQEAQRLDFKKKSN